jgi:hypothetical protein
MEKITPSGPLPHPDSEPDVFLSPLTLEEAVNRNDAPPPPIGVAEGRQPLGNAWY